MTNDDLMNKLIILREVKLFEKLSSEVLFAVAKEIQWREAIKEERLFSAGDLANGLYIIASGKVRIEFEGKLTSLLGPYDFFGEIGVLSDIPRLGSAIMEEDGMLLYMDNATFNDLSYDFPEMMQTVTHVVVGYLQKALVPPA